MNQLEFVQMEELEGGGICFALGVTAVVGFAILTGGTGLIAAAASAGAFGVITGAAGITAAGGVVSAGALIGGLVACQ